ncbi:hypothetical protein ADL15_38600 [Actinoplanes awajinensis subsp. mycoplanecinus]|uniref:Uncharacterized protein n=2 Tax=Actinoplanes awajinensis TaxID=135946 RepID=A0A101JGD0_9ACTN|nr:hypothetical protein ADL15_38600 [Actinoplanes awajinensis subsp. mycoplanecinus]
MRVHDLPGESSLRRVLVPATPLRRMHITKVLWHHSGALIGSQADLLRLGALVRLAAASPHSLVYLPLRENVRSEAVTYWADGQGLADLVIARSDTALRPSAWPTLRSSVRRGLKVGALATMRTPAPRLQPGERQSAKEWERERHQLRATEHADTLLLSGSARAMHEVGDELHLVR